MAMIDTASRGSASRSATGLPVVVEDEPRALLARLRRRRGTSARPARARRERLPRAPRPAPTKRAAAAAARSRSSSSATAASIDSARGRPLRAEPRGARALRAARPDVRPLEPPALARAGSALAALPRLAGRGRAGRHGARRGDRDGGGRDRARPPDRLPRRRARPEPRDARRGRASASRPPASRSGSGSSRAAPSSFRSPTASFDALTFTYLLRYVEDPAATLARARAGRAAGRDDGRARVRASAGRLAAAVGGSTSASGCRSPGRSISPGWHEVGAFLGPEHPRASTSGCRSREQLELWREAGIEEVRARRLSLGGGDRHLGPPRREAEPRRPSTRSRRAAGATT